MKEIGMFSRHTDYTHSCPMNLRERPPRFSLLVKFLRNINNTRFEETVWMGGNDFGFSYFSAFSDLLVLRFMILSWQ